ncbi:sialin-like [Planococcus citri]|uniref:sialin-like n=1 Tax=Planococcus citri TaxID=170843 RepID=UPI0031F8C871
MAAIKEVASILLPKAQDDEKLQKSVVKFQIGMEKPSLIVSKRFLVTILLFLSNANMVFVKYNVNIAVIEMTSSKSTFVNENLTTTQHAEFQWDSIDTGLALSIYFYGNLLSFLSGFIISKFGGWMSMAGSMTISSITTFLQPITLSYSFYLFLFCRFLTGVFTGFAYSGFTEACSHWMPKSERGTLMSICFNGFHIATATVHLICGIIISEWGWPMVFYITGIVGSLISILCLLLVSNHPSEDKWISKKELTFILNDIDTSRTEKVKAHPHKHILRSTPVRMFCIMNILLSWTSSTVVTSLPLFIKDSTGRNTKEVAFISSLPNFLGILVSTVSGPLMDYWKNHSNITQTRMHKIMIGIALTSELILFVSLTFVRDLITTMVIFVLIGLFLPYIFLVLQLILTNMVPNHTGLISGYMSFWNSMSPIAAQTVLGFMTPNHAMNEWDNYFLLTAGILLLGTILFTLYGSSEPQSWSLSPNFENKSKPLNKDEVESLTNNFD